MCEWVLLYSLCDYNIFFYLLVLCCRETENALQEEIKTSDVKKRLNRERLNRYTVALDIFGGVCAKSLFLTEMFVHLSEY